MTMARNDKAPVTLPSSARIAVMAGSGLLPQQVVDGLLKAGHRPIVVAIEGEAEWAASADADTGYDLWTIPAARLALLLPRLKRAGVTHLVMAGGVAQRPPLRTMRFGLDLFKVLPRLISAYAKGDDGLLRAVIDYVEQNGIAVVGVHQIIPDLLAPVGVLTKTKPRKSDQSDIAAALEAARAIGALDIGQAAIAIGGRAVALEGIEGTAGLLERMRSMRDHGRLAGKKGGVLAKCLKPRQELRADLPTIGPETIVAAHAAGLSGVVLEAGRSLILDHAATIARANEYGLFVVGVEEDG